MSLKYESLQHRVGVELQGQKTMTGSAVHLAVLDLTNAKYGRGIKNVMLVVQNVTLAGDVTIIAQGNTAANGGGTDTNIQTMVLDSAESDACFEIPAELLAHYADRAGASFKSVVFQATGTNNDTLDAALVVESLNLGSLTDSDPTAVTDA